MAAMTFDLVEQIRLQREFSFATFGPGPRTHGIIEHIRKELLEIADDPSDLKEWVDVVTLALDGAHRAGHSPEAIACQLGETYRRNTSRHWPDWRSFSEHEAIEHVRTEPQAEPPSRTGPTR